MAKKQACRTCKMFVDGNNCPNCGTHASTSDNWKGRIYIVDIQNSSLAAKINAKMKGEYALKVQ